MQESFDVFLWRYHILLIHVAGSALGGAGPNAVLQCEAYSVLCVLEQQRVDNSSAEPLKRGAQLVQLA